MSKQTEGKPPIGILHPKPSRVQRAWRLRMSCHRGLRGFDPRLESMSQWELEAYLGGLVGRVRDARDRAESAEMQALKARWDEAETLAEISECRRRLGLPDGAIGQSVEADGDA